MGKYANIRQYELRYSDFDFKDELKPSSFLALIQESACASADELGFGYSDLKPLHYGFIVVNTYCAFRRPVVLGDKLTVETWPLPPRHVIFERDYRVTCGTEEVAAAASRWCLVDLGDFSLLPPERLGETHARCPYRAETIVAPPRWKIPPSNGEEALRITVKNSHCDHYFHANNARYADFFLDCFTIGELTRKRLTAFQISYLKQAKENAELVFFREDAEDGVLLEARSEGEPVSRFRAWFTEDV